MRTLGRDVGFFGMRSTSGHTTCLADVVFPLDLRLGVMATRLSLTASHQGFILATMSVDR